MIMAATRGYLRSLAQAGLPLAEVTEGLNRLLLEDLDDRHFVTMLVASLDIPSGALTWANMGHPSAFVLDASGAVKTTLRSTCKPLGLFVDLGSTLGEPVVVEPGETVVLLTDGVLEAESPAGAQHGAEGALAAVRAHLDRPAAEIVAAIIAAARAHAAGATQEDDITAVVVKRTAT
jgi:serine phosphatase RsbU (regulator of sigma subunit)